MANDSSWAPKTVEAWAFVQKMLGDITGIVTADAENERELLEGLGVISRVTALCSELTVEADPELPWFLTAHIGSLGRGAAPPISACRCWRAPA